MNRKQQVDRLRGLAERYMTVAGDPAMNERRETWRAALSRRPGRTPVRLQFGLWNAWAKDYFPPQLQCETDAYRQLEQHLLVNLFHAGTGDDNVFEPWYSVWPSRPRVAWGLEAWGVKQRRAMSDTPGGAWKSEPPLKDWNYRQLLQPPRHEIDEEDTRRRYELLRDAVGDILPLEIHRGPALINFCGDISTHLSELRGLEQLMVDMCEAPEELKGLLAFMRDAILANQREAEDAGHFSLSMHENQMCRYCDDLPDPKPNAPCRRRDLWGFMAAQEYALVGPAMHDEFLLQYQRPIMKPFGLIHYGCCEDLTRKIDLLRQIPNLRSIAVTPMADPVKCAEQIGTDYFASWRPSPADLVSTEWNEPRMRKILRHGLDAFDANGCRTCILLKDIENVNREPDRLRRFVAVAREEAER
jgi:hypothetical protein